MSPLEVTKSELHRSKLKIFTAFQGYVVDLAEQRLEIHLVVCTENERHVSFAKVERNREVFMVQPCKGMEHLLQKKLLSPNTGSDDCLKQMSDWYNHCLQNHSICNRWSLAALDSVYFLKRLLDLNAVQDKAVLMELGPRDVALPIWRLVIAGKSYLCYGIQSPPKLSFVRRSLFRVFY